MGCKSSKSDIQAVQQETENHSTSHAHHNGVYEEQSLTLFTIPESSESKEEMVSVLDIQVKENNDDFSPEVPEEHVEKYMIASNEGFMKIFDMMNNLVYKTITVYGVEIKEHPVDLTRMSTNEELSDSFIA